MAPSYRVLAALCAATYALAQTTAKFYLDPHGPGASPTLQVEKASKGRSIYARCVYKRSGKELFRVCIGGKGSQLWRFGITKEADFNADGRTDYAWHGGDDTTSQNFLFLSCVGGYCGYDLTRSIAAAYSKRFKAKIPDLAANDLGTQELTLRREEGRLSVAAQIVGLSTRPVFVEVGSQLWLRLKPPDAAYFPAGQATP